jgi:hypothetical protein
MNTSVTLPLGPFGTSGTTNSATSQTTEDGTIVTMTVNGAYKADGSGTYEVQVTTTPKSNEFGTHHVDVVTVQVQVTASGAITVTRTETRTLRDVATRRVLDKPEEGEPQKIRGSFSSPSRFGGKLLSRSLVLCITDGDLSDVPSTLNRLHRMSASRHGGPSPSSSFTDSLLGASSGMMSSGLGGLLGSLPGMAPVMFYDLSPERPYGRRG